MYRNPVIPGFAPDPSICFWNGTYYLVTSTFEYFPGVTIWKSTDLVNWSFHRSVLDRESQLDLSLSESSSGIYAPTIRVNSAGRFYMVTTNKFTRQNFICHTDDIDGPWSEITPVLERTDSGWSVVSDGIDPSLLFLPDGRCFYVSNGTIDGVKGLKGAFIDPDTGKLEEPFRLLTTGCGGPNTEGPHLYFRDGWYYLMFAEGGTEYGHTEMILRSRRIHGPYRGLKTRPILSHVPRKGHPIQATGHADLIDTPDGRTFAVFLGIRIKPRPRLHHLGRETFLAPVTWTDGWPMIGDGGKVELEMQSSVEQIPCPDYSVDFSRPISDYPYLKVRVPKDDCYIQDTEGRTMTLVGEDELRKHLGHPTLLGFRQRGFKEEMKVRLDLSSMDGSTTAGISSWVSSDYHYRLQVRKGESCVKVSLIRHVHDFEAETESLEIPRTEGVLELMILSTDESYLFHADGKLVGKATVYALAAEGTMYSTFTGALFAIYAEHGKAVFREGIEMRSLT